MANAYGYLVALAWRYSGKEKKWLAFVYTLHVFDNVVIGLAPLLYGWFINSIQKKGSDILSYAWMYAIAFITLKLVEWTFHAPARIMEYRLAFNLSSNMVNELYHKILHLPMEWHRDSHSGVVINRIQKAYKAFQDFLKGGSVLFSVMAKFWISLIAIVAFSPLFGSIGAAIGLLTVWIIHKLDKPFIRSVEEFNEKGHLVNSSLFDSISNINTVVTLRLQERMEDNLRHRVSETYKPFNQSIRLFELKWGIADILVALIYAITVVGYIYQHTASGTFMVGNLIALLGFVIQFTGVFQNIAYFYALVVQYGTDVKTAQVIVDAYKKHENNQTESLSRSWSHIRVSNLSFSHSGDPRRSLNLDDVEINLQKGKRIAFIGQSGSGKSTMMSVLRGLYTPASETLVTLDHHVPISMASLGTSVTLIPQEPEIFETSIEHNITLGLKVDYNELMEVCSIAQFSEVVNQLPNGLKSHINEKGVNLSGGQKQRLALARGILAAKSSDIVLLDEPTSNIDAKTELQIYHRIFEECREKVLVSSLHRLYLLPHFDYIYIFDNGKIADHGTFEDLKTRSTRFKDMYRHQDVDIRHEIAG